MTDADKITLREFLAQYHPPGAGSHYRKGDATAVNRIEALIDDCCFRAQQDAAQAVSRRLRDEAQGFYRRGKAHRRAALLFVLVAVVAVGIAVAVGLR